MVVAGLGHDHLLDFREPVGVGGCRLLEQEVVNPSPIHVTDELVALDLSFVEVGQLLVSHHHCKMVKDGFVETIQTYFAMVHDVRVFLEQEIDEDAGVDPGDL